MLIIFANNGFFNFMNSVNRGMKKSVNKSKRKEKPRNIEKEDEELS